MGEQMKTAVSLFAGVGGFDLALQNAGVKVVASVEIDKKAQDVLRRHFPDSTIFGDITGVTGEQLRAAGLYQNTESLQGDFLAKIYQLLESEQGLKDRVVDFSGKSVESLTKQERKTLSSKMCLVYFPQMGAEIWPLSLKRWCNADIASPGGYCI